MSKKANEKRKQRADKAAEKAAILQATLMTAEQIKKAIEEDPQSLISAQAVAGYVFERAHKPNILEQMPNVSAEIMSFFRRLFTAGYTAGMNHETTYKGMMAILNEETPSGDSEPEVK